MTDCIAYLTIADVRAEFGDSVAELTDAQIQRKLDRLAATLEDNLGHTFGRAAIIRSTGADNVAVTATKLTVGGDDYTFAAYGTLHALAAAVNAAGDTYSMEILPQVYAHTPCSLLNTLAATPCGPDYEDRVVLCLSALYYVASGDNTSHVFLPLPLRSITTVTENGLTIDSDGYWWRPGDPYIIKKLCACASTTSCNHPKGRWSNAYPYNIGVTYLPTWWGRVPQSLTGPMLEAFESQAGLGPMESESFAGQYSYRRATRVVAPVWETLGGGAVRQYAVSFMP